MFCSQPLMAATSSSHLRFDELPSGSSIENDWSRRKRKQALFWRLIDCVYGARYMAMLNWVLRDSLCLRRKAAAISNGERATFQGERDLA